MPTRSYATATAAHRAQRSASGRDLAARLGAQLEAEIAAQKVLGARFAQARQEAHMTQAQLAAKTGVQQSDISRFENGGLNATRDTLVKLARALKLEIVLRPERIT